MRIEDIKYGESLVYFDTNSLDESLRMNKVIQFMTQVDHGAAQGVIKSAVDTLPGELFIYMLFKSHTTVLWYSHETYPDELSLGLVSVSQIDWSETFTTNTEKDSLCSQSNVPIQLYQLPDDLQRAINVFGKYGILVDISVEYHVNGKKINNQ